MKEKLEKFRQAIYQRIDDQLGKWHYKLTNTAKLQRHPVCPHCGACMVRARAELKNGWLVFWLCECKGEDIGPKPIG